MNEVSFHKINTTNRKGDKLIHDAETWRHPTTTNHGSQTRREEEEEEEEEEEKEEEEEEER